MGGLRVAFLVLPLVALSCQQFTDSIDLRRNGELYRSPNYRARVAVDRAAFLAPLVDERQGIPGPGQVGGPYPVSYMSDGEWPRPLLEMLEDIIIDELRDSGVFASLVRDPGVAADTLVVRPFLMTARTAWEERPFGRRAFAEIGMRIVVYGPQPAGGERPVLLEREFGEVVTSEVTVRPPSKPQMFGKALRAAMGKLLGMLDQSNVARSGVPLDTGTREATSGRDRSR